MIICIYGQSGAGKTTVAKMLLNRFNRLDEMQATHIDGDDVRKVFDNQDYTRIGRINNLNRISTIAKYLTSQYKVVIISAMYPYQEARDFLNSTHDKIVWAYLHYDDDRGKSDYKVLDFQVPEDDNNTVVINTSKNNRDVCATIIYNFFVRLMYKS